ncbi:hypothetical protein GCM10023220_01030 [Streptomyces ziwulingensis]|uniref:Uncharacterized protein n=1 Tax=Streptomyces ziwulingensis TaxID=1045501 RepID=A0ABP9AM44_9ACTN
MDMNRSRRYWIGVAGVTAAVALSLGGALASTVTSQGTQDDSNWGSASTAPAAKEDSGPDTTTSDTNWG